MYQIYGTLYKAVGCEFFHFILTFPRFARRNQFLHSLPPPLPLTTLRVSEGRGRLRTMPSGSNEKRRMSIKGRGVRGGAPDRRHIRIYNCVIYKAQRHDGRRAAERASSEFSQSLDSASFPMSAGSQRNILPSPLSSHPLLTAGKYVVTRSAIFRDIP